MGNLDTEYSSFMPLTTSEGMALPVSSTDNISTQQLPSTLFEAFIPGYSFISSFFLHSLGIDITRIVTAAFFVFCAFTGVRYCYDHLRDLFKTYYTSTISIDSYDDIYDWIMDWIKDQRVAKDARKLHASMPSRGWDDTSMLDHEEFADMADGRLLNFSNWNHKMPPSFRPFFGTHRFRHNGRWFEFRREQRELLSGMYGPGLVREEEIVSLACIGRSTDPIKDLIRTCQNHSIGKKSFKTTVLRPSTKEKRMHGRAPWTRVAERPSRPMDTVVLDQDQKELVLRDINEYLHPGTFPWYATRGIPYRRGYLFHGPPGTGKTSLSFAIAGIFGLDIYCISLLEPTLTEEDLAVMFNALPRRCVVLLEDIDTAGVSRDDKGTDDDDDDDNDDDADADADEKKSHKDDNSESSPPELIHAEPSEAETRLMTARVHAELLKALGLLQKSSAKTAKAVKKTAGKGKDGDDDKKKGISLSSLLNVIDGVASHEGRVLVMTTNHPDKLDDALIRPGRVDMKVAFTLASHDQIRKLFVRMYANDRPHHPNFLHTKIAAAAAAAARPTEKAQHFKSFTRLSPNEIETLAVGNGHATKKKKEAELATPPSTPSSSSSSSSSSSEKEHAPAERQLPHASDLPTIAAEFARKLPDGAFTPAEIQGFLLVHKKEPMKALAEVEAWRERLQAAKAAKSKVV